MAVYGPHSVQPMFVPSVRNPSQVKDNIAASSRKTQAYSSFQAGDSGPCTALRGEPTADEATSFIYVVH